KNRQVIRLNIPTSRLGEHVHIPTAPAPLTVKEEENGAENRAAHHRNRASIITQPASRIPQRAPTFAKQIAHDWECGARNADDSRRRHRDSVEGSQNFRGAAFGAAPVNKTNQRHSKERSAIARDQKKRDWMRGPRQGAK